MIQILTACDSQKMKESSVWAKIINGIVAAYEFKKKFISLLKVDKNLKCLRLSKN